MICKRNMLLIGFLPGESLIWGIYKTKMFTDLFRLRTSFFFCLSRLEDKRIMLLLRAGNVDMHK